MKRTTLLLLAILTASLGLLGYALYLQLAKDMLPCPLCVAQRYAFAACALLALLALVLPQRLQRGLIVLGGLAAASGLSCGIDPLEVALNKSPLSTWLPTLFRANGLCDAPYTPILGLSIPAWALVWFIVFIGMFILAFFRQTPRGMFGQRR
jgi:protein dithiol:quinone oxidoreductase